MALSIGEKNNSRACKSAAHNPNNTNAIGALIHVKATKADEVIGTIQRSAFSTWAWGHVTAATNLSSVVTMKTERFAGHNEARQALVLAVAGVTAITLIANLILMLLY